jgi:hypothetical protein
MSTSSNKHKTAAKMGWGRQERQRRWWKTDCVKEQLIVKELCVKEMCVKELCVCVRMLCVKVSCVKELCDGFLMFIIGFASKVQVEERTIQLDVPGMWFNGGPISYFEDVWEDDHFFLYLFGGWMFAASPCYLERMEARFGSRNPQWLSMTRPFLFGARNFLKQHIASSVKAFHIVS